MWVFSFIAAILIGSTMPSITYDRFDLGLDLRKGPSVSDANRLRVLTNAYVTTGRQIQKRPVLHKIAELEAGTTGLKAGGGKLNTFYESGAIAHADARFLARKAAHPTSSQAITKAHYASMFASFMYAVVQYVDGSIWHHYFDGAVPSHISDVNCPQTRAAVKVANKIWAIDGENVDFCAAGVPRDWTTADDAGFIPVGRNQEGSSEVLAVGQFQKQLVAFFIDGAGVWDVDEDPALNKIKKSLYGIGTQFPRSPASFASDVFFLADAGFRSITIAAQTEDNFQDVDVGSPIDTVVSPTLSAGLDPMGIYVPGFGQYWALIPTASNTVVWVYSFSRSSKIAAWSKYTYPIVVEDAATLNNALFVRSGDNVYELSKSYYTDDGAPVPVEVELPYVDQKAPGILKQYLGADMVCAGTPNLAFRYNPNDETLITQAYPYSGDTRHGVLHPVELSEVNIAPVITHSADEDFRLDALSLYYDSLGPV